MNIEVDDLSTGWLQLLEKLLKSGKKVAPRKLASRELLGVRFYVDDLRANVLTVSERKLGYKFSVAEWLWIWYGRSDVATIARYNQAIAQFSDDGLTFNGAYGPPVRGQWEHLLATLVSDKDSRQGVISIFRPQLEPSKDVPCTLTLQFLLRRNKIHVIANMRSSDAWLGLPYDFYNFTQLANTLAGQLQVGTGTAVLNLGSSHLYQRDAATAEGVCEANDVPYSNPDLIRSPLQDGPPPGWLEGVLERPDTLPDAPDPRSSWQMYGRLLNSVNNKLAYEWLVELDKVVR